MRYRLYLVILAGFMTFGSIAGCNGNKPKNLIPENKYADLYVEFQLLRAYRHLYSDTTKIAEMRQRILNKYGVTMKQFRESDAYYEVRPGQDNRIHKALDRISTVKDSIWNSEGTKPDNIIRHPGNAVPKPKKRDSTR